jgi:hypothetical protein
VNNTVSDPVRVRNVNDAIQPFQATGSCAKPNICTAIIFTVPTGKRAVIEYFSGTGGIAATPAAGQVFFVTAHTQTGSTTQENFVPNVPITLLGGSAGNGTWGQHTSPNPVTMLGFVPPGMMIGRQMDIFTSRAARQQSGSTDGGRYVRAMKVAAARVVPAHAAAEDK